MGTKWTIENNGKKIYGHFDGYLDIQGKEILEKLNSKELVDKFFDEYDKNEYSYIITLNRNGKVAFGGSSKENKYIPNSSNEEFNYKFLNGEWLVEFYSEKNKYIPLNKKLINSDIKCSDDDLESSFIYKYGLENVDILAKEINLEIYKHKINNENKYSVRVFGKSKENNKTEWKDFIDVSEYEYSVILQKVLGKTLSFVWDKNDISTELFKLSAVEELKNNLVPNSTKSTLYLSNREYEIGDLILENSNKIIGNIYDLDLFDAQDKLSELIEESHQKQGGQ